MVAGLEGEVTQQFMALGTNSMIVSTRPATELRGRPPVPLQVSDYRTLERRVPHPVTLAPLVNVSGTARACGRSRIVSIVGTTSDWAPLAGSNLSQGRFLQPPDDTDAAAVCVLGAAVANDFGCARVGDSVLVSGRPCEVIGVLRTARDYDLINHSDSVFVPLDRVRTTADLPPIALLVKAPDASWLALSKTTITEELRLAHRLELDDPEDFTVTEQSELVAGYEAVFAAVRHVALGVVSLLVLLTLVTLVISLNAGIRERLREIGLLRCIGAPKRLLRAEVLAEGLTVAAVGAIVGETLTISVGYILKSTGALAFGISLPAAIGCWLFLVIAGVGAALWPAFKASSISPWDSLRTE